MRTVISLFAMAVFAGAVGVAGAFAAAPAPAPTSSCPGRPNALGTSRVLAIEFAKYLRVGLMQYPQTLPLADKEVVLTFDDGPLPPYSNRILDILAAQCVKATYFLIGSMAHEFPAVVRRIYAEGHTIGTHSESHPLPFRSLPIGKMRWQIDQGIADVSAALGDAGDLAPFFRIPGLERTDHLERELAARSLIVFSADVVADDWHRHIKPSEIIRRAMRRLEARGKGVLLLHDIHPATVAALPGLLKALKDHGFRVVHVVPALPNRIEIADGQGGPASLTPWANNADPANWPKVVAGPSPEQTELPVPARQAFGAFYRPWEEAIFAGRGDAGEAGIAAIAAAVAAAAQSPDRLGVSPPYAATELAVPSMQDIGVVPNGWRFVGKTVKLRASLAVAGPRTAGIAASSVPSSN